MESRLFAKRPLSFSVNSALPLATFLFSQTAGFPLSSDCWGVGGLRFCSRATASHNVGTLDGGWSLGGHWGARDPSTDLSCLMSDVALAAQVVHPHGSWVSGRPPHTPGCHDPGLVGEQVAGKGPMQIPHCHVPAVRLLPRHAEMLPLVRGLSGIFVVVAVRCSSILVAETNERHDPE